MRESIPGCRCGGTDELRIVSPPFIKPDPPKPATALPIINMDDETAAPQMADPTSNSRKKARNDH